MATWGNADCTLHHAAILEKLLAALCFFTAAREEPTISSR